MYTTIEDRRLRKRRDVVLQALILSLKLVRDLPTLNEQFCAMCHSKKGKEKRKVQKNRKGMGTWHLYN